MQSCVHSFSFLFFCPTDRPTFTRGRAMGNETFYGDGLRQKKKILCPLRQPEFHPITSSRYYSLRGENDSKQSDEFQATLGAPAVLLLLVFALVFQSGFVFCGTGHHFEILSCQVAPTKTLIHTLMIDFASSKTLRLSSRQAFPSM